MVIRTRKAKFEPWLIRPEKSGLAHGHSDQESQVWTMVNWTKKSQVWTMVPFRLDWTKYNRLSLEDGTNPTFRGPIDHGRQLDQEKSIGPWKEYWKKYYYV
jgi:hypothetical protein